MRNIPFCRDMVLRVLYVFLIAIVVSFVQHLLIKSESSQANAEENYQFVTKWGSNGTGDGQFNAPYGVAVDTTGNIYAIDYGYNSRIQKFSSDGTFITKWGSNGEGDGLFNYPYGIAVDSSLNVYVADTENHRIQKFNSNGTFITKMGSYGITAGHFVYPKGVAVDASGNIYVADTNYHRIQKLNSGGSYITQWGSRGSGDGQFIQPIGIAVDATGNVYVSDSANSRIQKFSSDGTFITKWGSYGSGNGQFMWPMHLAVDTLGNIYVADSSNNRIQKFSSSGTFLTKLDGFNKPYGVSIDSSGNIYVADTYNYSIQKFSPVTISSPTVTGGSATNVTSSSATLNGMVNANGASTTAWFNYGTTSSSYTGTSTTQSISGSSDTSVSIDINGLSPVTTYYYRIAASNSAGISYGNESFFTTSESLDTTAPIGTISANSGVSYTNSTTVTLNLSATDSVGVTGYYISESLSYPSASASGWTSVTSTTSYSANISYSLSGSEGSKTIYVWYKDAAGNVSSTASATITLDTTVPTVTISSPTSSSTYTTTASTISLGGSASDSSSGISSVMWSNNRGGNGTATGTASWSVSGISLSSGGNVITVTATDGAGNTGTDTLQVTYGTSSTVSVPVVSTGSASNVSTSSATLGGTVNANGGTTTVWFNYGISSGSYTGTSTTQTVTGSSNTAVSIGISGLSSGTNYYYRIAAQNSAGTSYGSEASFTTSTVNVTPTPPPSASDTTAPANASITINDGESYTNSTTVTVTLSATDNVGVTGYYLSTSSSTPAATASGWNSVSSTTSYSGSASYPLASGDGNKTIYAWFKDAAGNISSAASDSIILDTTAPIVTITSPTSGDTYTASGNTISLSGSASDSLSGVSSVTWRNSRGGSVDASGTTYWSVSSISLVSGENKITVTAKDTAGNTATDTIAVTYTASSVPPTVKTGSATDVTKNSATLSGTVNANGLSTTVWFEYGTLSGSYGNKSSTQSVIGSTDTEVSITITGLTAGTTYYYRIAAQSNAGISYGEEMSFYKSSAENPPTVETEAATNITNTTAKLNGKCNPNGQSTTVWFEYGTLSGTYNYQTSTQSLSGSSYTSVSATITGLTVGTKYYYRIAAQNSAGTSYGEEMSFYKSTETQTTPTPLPTPTVPPQTGVIIGIVVDAMSGVPISGADMTTNNGGYTATTVPDGSFTIPDVAEGNYTLTASTIGYHSSSQVVTVLTGIPTRADFALVPDLSGTPIPTPIHSGSIVFGFVLDENEDALRGVVVTITRLDNSQFNSAETDEDGYYEFSGLAAGRYKITFEKSGYRTHILEITLSGEEEFEVETVILEEEVKGSIYGYVVDIYGSPIESVRLRLKGLRTRLNKRVASDSDGFFEFADLRKDTYVINANKKSYRKTKAKVELEEGEAKEIEIEMRKSSSSRRVIQEGEE